MQSRDDVESEITRIRNEERRKRVAPVEDARQHVVGWKPELHTHTQGGGFWYAKPVFDADYQVRLDRKEMQQIAGAVGCLGIALLALVLVVVSNSEQPLILVPIGLISGLVVFASAPDVPGENEVIRLEKGLDPYDDER